MAEYHHYPFYYDNQLRRILLQFSRIFAGFRVKTGQNSQGFEEFISVPVLYGEGERQALHIIKGASENTVQSVPRIAVSFQDLTPAALKRGRSQALEQTLLVTERQFDDATQQYTTKTGNTYQVTTLAPNPVDIKFKVDIWTSNTDQKFQLFEQIFLLFNPSMDFQTSSSPLDWTALNIVTLDSINWDDQGVNRGTTDNINVMSMTFLAECYINPAARVTKQSIINTIIENLAGNIDDAEAMSSPPWQVVTPGDHKIQVNGSQITLLGAGGNIHDENGNIYSWPQLIDQYGELTINQSKITLRWVSDITNSSLDIMGYISLDPTYDNILDFTVISDTLPIVTQVAVNNVINPLVDFPGNNLPAAATGQRYIITNNIGADTYSTVAWGSLVAQNQDIIQYNGSNWVVSLDAQTDTTLEFVYNSNNGDLLKLINHEWIDAINLEYSNGYWQFYL